jgi:hypothetical protein
VAGDYSRLTERLLSHFSTVLMEQGRVHLDADWNEAMRTALRRVDTQAWDTFGPAAVPRFTTPQGFQITAAGGAPADLAIGAGRCYVDGIVAELFAGEKARGKPVSYLNQPFYPAPPPISGSGLVYLDVWRREVTAVEDPALLDSALGGVDTTTRLQTVWQVKLLTASAGGPQPGCDADLNSAFPPSAGRLSTAAVGPVAPTDPCILPDQGGYRGVENRLYRVEIHKGGDASKARWKWSRENASVVSRVQAIATAGVTTLTVDRIGRDSILRFSANDWVEIVDDSLELMGEPGVMAKIAAAPDDANRTLTLDRALPAGRFDPSDPSRHTRIIRWDQKAGVDADGLLSIAAGAVELEDGVQVTLTLDTSGPTPSFHVRDFWAFAARAADASVETLDKAPPFAIEHHYCALAPFATAAGGAVGVDGDCRVLWPPPAGGGGECYCTVCVSAEQHNSGKFTIVMGLEQLRRSGGRLCLGPGVFNLGQTPIVLRGYRAVTISGHGSATVLVFSGAQPAIMIDSSFDAHVVDLALFAFAATVTGGVGVPVAIAIRNCLAISVERCIIAAGANQSAASVGIALDGFIADASFDDNVIVAAIGIGKAAAIRAATGLALMADSRAILLVAGMACRRNWMFCFGVDVAIGDSASWQAQPGILTFFALDARFEDNRLFGGRLGGIVADGYVLPGAALRIERNLIEVQGAAIACGVEDATINDNQLTQADLAKAFAGAAGFATAPPRSVGVLIFHPLRWQTPPGEFRILRNHIVGVAGPGILIDGPIGSALIGGNSIFGASGAGVLMSGNAAAAEVDVFDNSVGFVAGPAYPNEPAIVGVGLWRAASASLRGNTVALIGNAATGEVKVVGVSLRQGTRATVASNYVNDVGPPGLAAAAAGVRFEGAFETVVVDGNRIARATTEQGDGQWTAIEAVNPSEGKSADKFTLSDNIVTGVTVRPLVNVNRAGDCVFSGNHCAATMGPGFRSSTVVDISGDTIICGNNRVRGDHATDGVVLIASKDANQQPLITVLGNIVHPSIKVGDGPLAAPWAPLNTISPT